MIGSFRRLALADWAGTALCSVILLPGLARAEVIEKGIEVSTTPTLTVLAVEDGAKVLGASGGMVVHLTVLARLSDGSTQDVTQDAATTYTALAPDIASVNQSGALVFTHPGGAGLASALVLVERNSFTTAIGFNVAP
jgi:hypothetical protein